MPARAGSLQMIIWGGCKAEEVRALPAVPRWFSDFGAVVSAFVGTVLGYGRFPSKARWGSLSTVIPSYPGKRSYLGDKILVLLVLAKSLLPLQSRRLHKLNHSARDRPFEGPEQSKVAGELLLQSL